MFQKIKDFCCWHGRQIAKAFDQLCNAILLGYADETLSARSYRARDYWYGRFMMHFINALFFNRNHCKEAYEREHDLPDEYLERLQTPK